MNRQRVIYIMGLGRSGTTLLDVILGNAEGAFSCGELNRYSYEEGRPYQFPSGHPAIEAWERIRIKMNTKFHNGGYENMRKLSRRYEYHSGLLRNYFHLITDRNAFDALLDFNEYLYETVLKVSGCSILIDSSKYSSRAMFLSNSKKFEILYIYIQRDPIDVVNSFAKKDVEQGSRNWLSANFYYFVGSLLCSLAVHWLKKKGLKVCKIRHEKLLDKPFETIDAIEKSLEIDLSYVKKIVMEDGDFHVGTLFYGNRVRLLDKLKLKRATRSKMAFSDLCTRMINLVWYR